MNDHSYHCGTCGYSEALADGSDCLYCRGQKGSKSVLFILGAADPEMQAIKALLTQAGVRFAYAATRTAKGDQRVHPGNAYQADGCLIIDPSQPGILGGKHETLEWTHFPHADEIVLVECGFIQGHVCQPGTVPVCMDQQAGMVYFCSSGMEEWSYDILISRIDHHRPGDPGYGQEPARFMAASSLGQVLQKIHGGTWMFFVEHGKWALSESGMDIRYAPTDEEVMSAAADHCLESAYRGLCPGVDPDALMRWRAESRAAFQKRPVGEVLADIENARWALRRAMETQGQFTSGCSQCGTLDHVDCYYGEYIEPRYVNFYSQHIPELPEAACREGIPFLSQIKDRDGREKVVLQAAPASLVQEFLAGSIVPGLKDCYGDPARGFAGGYLP